jgi:hypothetical protein
MPTTQARFRVSILGEWSLSCCTALQSICIPTSLCQITGLALAGSELQTVIVKAKNQSFRVSDCFLVDFAAICLVRYFGHEMHVSISPGIETVSPGCFCHYDSVRSITFEPGCKISVFGEFAFERCSFLQSICIPSSIETISKSGFADCRNLVRLTFAAGCRIAVLG